MIWPSEMRYALHYREFYGVEMSGCDSEGWLITKGNSCSC
jgi:hypothetical protein